MQTLKVRCRGVIIHEGELLVVKHSHGREFYALPGGHLDHGEDPKECIEREIKEELGVVPRVGRLLYVYSFVNGEGVQSIEFFFEIKNGGAYREHEQHERTHAHEIDEVQWVSPQDEVHILPERFAREFQSGEVLKGETRFLKN